MNDKIKAFKEKLFAAAEKKGFSDCEIFMSGNDTFSLRVFKGEIAEYKNAGASGLCFRGTYNGKMGYAFTEKIDDDAIDFLVNNAAGNAEIIEDPEVETLYPGDKEYAEVKTYEPSLAEVPVEDRIDKALKLEKAAFDESEKVAGVDYCMLNYVKGAKYMANSLGLEVSSQSNVSYGVVSARVGDEKQYKTYGDAWVGHNWTEFNPEKTSKEVVQRALSLLGAKPVPSKAYDIILERDDASSLFMVFSGMFSAESVQKGLSLLKGKLGEAVAASNITIRDDALLDFASGSCPSDDEGVATYNKAVVENGILKTFLHNTKTAKKDGVKSTGNGHKPSYKSPVGVRPNNLYIVPSEKTKEDLIKEMGNGLVIFSLAGLHSGANPISGDFSVSAEGYLVENGEIVSPVEQITIAGNFYTVLNNIVDVANDLTLTRMNIASPSLWIKDISVSGI